MAEDYDYELDYSPDTYDDYGDYFGEGADYTLRDLWYDCLVPTVYDGLASSSKLILCCTLLKFSLRKFVTNKFFVYTVGSQSSVALPVLFLLVLLKNFSYIYGEVL